MAQQPVFTVQVNFDSLLLGNRLEVKFTLENAQDGEMNPPDFGDLRLVAGPNYSSMMSVVNGAVSQSKSFTYILEPKDIGNYFIPPASITVGDQVLETQPLEVIVVPNPDGLIQQPQQDRRSNDWFFNYEPPLWKEQKPSKMPKRKRKIYKI